MIQIEESLTSNQESLNVLGEEGNEDETNHRRERDDHGLAVTISLRNDTVDEETQDLTNLSTVGKSRLPWCWDCVRSIRLDDTVFSVELRKTVEGAKKDNVVAFHDDSGGEKNGPSDGLRVEPESFANSHGMLLVGGIFGFSCKTSEVCICDRCLPNDIVFRVQMIVVHRDF